MSIRSHRRHFVLRLLPAAALAPWLPSIASTQPIPELMRVFNGYPPGGSVDVVSRKLAEKLTGRIARAAVVENKPGAAGRLAIESLKNALPDGTSMAITPASVVTMYPHIYRTLSYDPFRDLTPVSMVAATSFAIAVGPLVPSSVTRLGEFLDWCRANPALAQCGNAGAGSFPHFMALLLAREARVDLTHVPYRGGLASMQAVVAGQVSSALATESTVVALEQAGRLRVLAVTGTERSTFMPHVPMFRELGYPALTQREWFGAYMPARTPPPLVTAAAEHLRAALADPEVQAVWNKLALSPVASTPDELLRAQRAEHDFWGPVIRASGFTPEA